jgi:trimethylamine--corrinoid protein Co-methyltransferase
VRVEARLQVLSREECEQVHARSLEVLARTGVRVDSGAARALLREAGAAVDEGSRRVCLPPDLVKWALAQAGRRFTLGGRRPGWSFAVNEGGFTLLADGGATAVLDGDGPPRRPTRDDWEAATRLLDALDDVGLYWCPTEYPADIERPAVFVRYLADVFATFGKHVQESFGDPALAPWCREVLDIVFGGREAVRERRPLSFLITPASPLVLEAGHVDAWLGLRDYGLPVALMPMPLQGATAPGSRLATLVTANCEVLAALCLVQVAAPGTPVLYAPVPATMEPRSGLYAAGAPEHAAMGAAGTAMARHYGLPAESSGLTTQTFVPDLQTAWEKGMSALLAVLAAPDVLVGPGLLAGATVLSLVQIVLDVEVVRWARRAAEGVPVQDDLWLDDVLAAVGPGGTFLGERSTRRNVRGGEWGPPGLGVSGSREAWQAAGAPGTLAEARARVGELLAGHEPEPLPDDVRAALDALVRRAAAG